MLQEIPKGVKLPINKGVDMINAAIRAADKAKTDSTEAKVTAEQALSNSERTQTELDQAILKGDSSPLGGQLSVGADGTVYDSAQDRLIKEHNDKSQVILSSTEPADTDDNTYWYEDLGETPIKINTDSLLVANAQTSETAPDTKDLWFKTGGGS